jgi:hypothetical protein
MRVCPYRRAADAPPRLRAPSPCSKSCQPFRFRVAPDMTRPPTKSLLRRTLRSRRRMPRTQSCGASSHAEAGMDHVTGRGQDALRAWQREALEAYEREARRDFLVTATPARARQHLRSRWPPGCSIAASSTAKSWSARPTICEPSGPKPLAEPASRSIPTSPTRWVRYVQTCPATSQPMRKWPPGPAACGADRSQASVGDPRRGAPRRRRAHLGRRGGRGVRGRDSAVVPDHLMALVAS